jgi:tetratricopeptide (TPR) repeat protein
MSLGGSEILSEQPGNVTTPIPSLVFLTDALIDQCPRNIDGSIRIKDVVDLINGDPSHSVASALGIPSAHDISQLFSESQFGVKATTITRDGLLEILQTTRFTATSSSVVSNSSGTTSAVLASDSLMQASSVLGDDVSQVPSPPLSPSLASNDVLGDRRRAEVRGVPFPKPPPENMSLPPKAPKNPPLRSPKRKRFTIGVEGGNVRADARGRYTEVLRDDPNNTDALEHIGFFYVDAGKPTKALEALNRARMLGCDNLRLWRSTGRAHYLKWRQTWGNLESELGSTDIPMQRVLRKMPDDEHLQAAHLAYERCTQFHMFVPDSKFWHELGVIYFHFRAYEGAIGVFRHITRDDPKYEQLNEVVVLCGIMYYRLKKYAESIECWKKVLHDPPLGFKERNVLFILGYLHRLNGDDDASQASFEEVYDFVRKRNLQVSEEQYSRVKSTRDYVQDPDTWYNECRLYVRNGFYELAEDTLKQALKYSKDVDAKLGVPNYSSEKLKEIWVGLSRTWAFRMNKEEALKAMVEAQAARPYDYYVRESLIQMDPDPDKWTDIFVMESKHALSLSRTVRGHLERQRLRRERKVMGVAATKMARIFRGVRWRIRLKSLYLTLVDRRKHVRTRRSRALVRMQSIARMLKMRNDFFKKKYAALKISSGIRGLLGRTKALRRRNEVMEQIRRRNNRAATIIQSTARGFALR